MIAMQPIIVQCGLLVAQSVNSLDEVRGPNFGHTKSMRPNQKVLGKVSGMQFVSKL